MANPVIKIEGVNEIARELHRRQMNVENGLEEILHAAAEVLQEASAANVRATSQSMADEMARETLEKKPGFVAVGVGPDKEHWYAHIIEFGAKGHAVATKSKKALLFVTGALRPRTNHPGLPARPFLRPAFDTRQGEAQDVAAKKFKEKTGAA